MASKTLGAESALGNVIQFPGRFNPPSPRRLFLRACIAAEIARAEYELTHLHCQTAQLDGTDADNEVARAKHWQAFERLTAATDALALVPAPTLPLLDRKKRALGAIWLKAPGERYDRLREGVAADLARLRK